MNFLMPSSRLIIFQTAVYRITKKANRSINLERSSSTLLQISPGIEPNFYSIIYLYLLRFINFWIPPRLITFETGAHDNWKTNWSINFERSWFTLLQISPGIGTIFIRLFIHNTFLNNVNSIYLPEKKYVSPLNAATFQCSMFLSPKN